MIDVSGSMWENACKTVAGMETIDMSRLQLVQHALKTIVETFGDTDEVVLITFNERAQLDLPPTKMHSDGKITANRVINAMNAQGRTNIWDALRLGLEQAKTFSGRGFNISLLLFTDGEPNQNPLMGIVPTLKEALSEMNQDFAISTFGFGYAINSGLMENIARLGHGVYGYCPDCTMLGTILINFLAAALTTIAQHAILEIQNPMYQAKYNLTLVDGSSRNVLVDIPDGQIHETEIILSIPITGDRFVLNRIDPITDETDRLALVDQVYRHRLVKLISDNLFSPAAGLEQAQAMFNEIKAMPKITPYLEGLAVDLVDPHPNHGQVSKAFRQDFFQKWGKDYLRSHLLFHIVEQCGNFKDESLQGYGGAKFGEYRALGNKIFINLPPPIGRTWQKHQGGTITTSSSYASAYASASASASPSASTFSAVPVNIHKFYDYHGGCFDGNAIVSLVVGEKRVRDLEKGDMLIDGGIVECLIETVLNGNCEAVVLNGVAFTPFHPVEVCGKWVFPRDVGEIVEIGIDLWFNLVVRGNKVVELNGVRAITLGHGLVEGVLKHPYFGTEIVVNALKQYEGYESGRLRIASPATCERDENGMITGLF
jgi:hypothetical protein